jgi:hypothetical protein
MRAWLEIMRISNAPTVLSNGIAGGVLGTMAVDPAMHPSALDARWLTVLSPLACYIGGMVLNDAFDARIDARERPNRPIPSGRITRAEAFTVGALFLAGGVAVALAYGSVESAVGAAVLALLVIAYDAIHALTAGSIVLLAACRALAALVPMIAIAGDPASILSSGAALHAVLLAGWTLLLSFLARGEMKPPPAGLTACPSCGHLIPGGAARCSECGKTPNPAITQMRVIRSRLVVGSLFALAMIGVAVASITLLPRAPATVASATNPGCGAIPIGLVVALFLVAMHERHANGRLSTPRYIGILIATLAAIDTLALTAVGSPLAFATAACGIATLFLQRRIAGS